MIELHNYYFIIHASLPNSYVPERKDNCLTHTLRCSNTRNCQIYIHVHVMI